MIAEKKICKFCAPIVIKKDTVIKFQAVQEIIKQIFADFHCISRNLREMQNLRRKRFVENAKGFFEEHTQEEKEILMKNYCEQIQTEKVIAYCHYCVRGLRLGGKKTFHLAELLI